MSPSLPSGFTPHLIVEKFSSAPGAIVLTGILASVAGIAICGYAGLLRERVARFEALERARVEAAGGLVPLEGAAG